MRTNVENSNFCVNVPIEFEVKIVDSCVYAWDRDQNKSLLIEGLKVWFMHITFFYEVCFKELWSWSYTCYFCCFIVKPRGYDPRQWLLNCYTCEIIVMWYYLFVSDLGLGLGPGVSVPRQSMLCMIIFWIVWCLVQVYVCEEEYPLEGP